MKISNKGLKIISDFEGLRLRAYQDQVGIWTIGYGSTFYEDGSPVKKGDIITTERAKKLLSLVANNFAIKISPFIKSDLNQNQVDSIISLTYNIGVAGFSRSTVLKLINNNPSDLSIRSAFMMWKKGRIRGKLVIIPGLEKRRKLEADLYFS